MLRGFSKRHPNLSFRKPQGISKARIKVLAPEKLNTFFDLLEQQMQKTNHNNAKNYNVDESGITTINIRVIGLIGKIKVGAVFAAERRSLVSEIFLYERIR